MKVTINEAVGFSQKELDKLHRSAKLLEKIISLDAYGAAVLNADFSGETSPWQYKTNREILNHIRSGKEVLLPVVDHEADISITIFNPNFFNRNVVGYTYPTKVMQWINRKFFMLYSDTLVAGNMMHEWLHKMGFDHDFKPTSKRPYSVCYQHNKIIKELSSRLEGEEPTQITKDPGSTKLSLFARIKRFFSRLF